LSAHRCSRGDFATKVFAIELVLMPAHHAPTNSSKKGARGNSTLCNLSTGDLSPKGPIARTLPLPRVGKRDTHSPHRVATSRHTQHTRAGLRLTPRPSLRNGGSVPGEPAAPPPGRPQGARPDPAGPGREAPHGGDLRSSRTGRPGPGRRSLARATERPPVDRVLRRQDNRLPRARQGHTRGTGRPKSARNPRTTEHRSRSRRVAHQGYIRREHGVHRRAGPVRRIRPQWLYVASVSVGLACPSRFCTTFTDSPCRIRRLA
jgi:hypothetical protein